MKNAENRRDNCINNIVQPDDNRLNRMKNEINNLKMEIEDLKGDLTLDKLNKNLKDLINLKKLNLKTLKAQLTTEKRRFTKATKDANAVKRDCKKEFTKDKKDCTNIMKKQEGMYQNLVFQKC